MTHHVLMQFKVPAQTSAIITNGELLEPWLAFKLLCLSTWHNAPIQMSQLRSQSSQWHSNRYRSMTDVKSEHKVQR